ncbi:MAG: hypothetical protein AAFN30_00860 [Actinomycetota bacterium]
MTAADPPPTLARRLGLRPLDRVALVGGGPKEGVRSALDAAGCHVAVAQNDHGSPLTCPAPFDLGPATEPITAVVSVIGAGALGRVIADRCHRPLRIAALAGCSPYRRLTPAAAAAVILHPRGGRRLAPGARLAVAIVGSDGGSDVEDGGGVGGSDGFGPRGRPQVVALIDELQAREPGVPVAEVGVG